jgi:hypothetical protein
MARRANPPDPVCPTCSKPVTSDSLVLFEHGEMYHVRCMSQAHQLRAINQADRARHAQAKSAENITRARRLIEEASRLQRDGLGPCSACGQPIRPGNGGYIRRSDGHPVHTECSKPQ